VIGFGEHSEQKVLELIDAGARPVVVTPHADTSLRGLASAGQVELVERHWEPSDLDEAFLVIADPGATGDASQLADEARRRRVLLSILDRPAFSHFTFGSVLRRGPLRIAVGTGGCSPLLARRLRLWLERRLPADSASRVLSLGRERRELLRLPDPLTRRARLVESVLRHFPLVSAEHDSTEAAPSPTSSGVSP
ncbi:MAG: NAD(P)-dependent oxidoreductase, partial [Acidobacteriota bacterium]